ncbi:hypothetical protein PACTADRAFT_51986 [Pachysolen tannophilus NRRL Y-2460]|uniref:Nucleolar protein 16 n=1 Tax=Pachysolen tannophilus NRRL Y-2460 TaxID=669874 RepID=A0A1E4TNQ5_PACTA|nr:hypothetical protein PACTADRAFT_51986 [Pachysolen tannophilus NRRL Y-2460]
MVSVRKRKINKSSVKRVSRRNKDKQRKINISSNPIIAANWDHSLTLEQNYKKLGLKSRLGKYAGGTEKDVIGRSRREKEVGEGEKITELQSSVNELESHDPSKIPEGEARIIRDNEGKVLEIIYGTKPRSLLVGSIGQDKSGSRSDSDSETETEVVKKLKELSKIDKSKPRIQSEREQEWVSKLYAKYGDDYEKMKWDKKLNIYQQSSGDLKRRILKWKRANDIQ